MTSIANHSSDARRPGGRDVGIDWEVLPSLSHLVQGARPGFSAGKAWVDTMPASLDELAPSPQMEEALPGLDVLVSEEPEIFRLFFQDGERP